MAATKLNDVLSIVEVPLTNDTLGVSCNSILPDHGGLSLNAFVDAVTLPHLERDPPNILLLLSDFVD